MNSQPRVKAFFYNNPDSYPPIYDSVRLMAKSGYSVDLFCRAGAQKSGLTYPDLVSVNRAPSKAKISWHEYLAYITYALKQTQKAADLYIGHYMHGFVLAKILAARHHRPLVYHNH